MKLQRADVLAHQTVVQWAELHQVEQDLLLSLAMTRIFNDSFLAKQVAMRGGTVLHKVHLAPAVRYSEDIDLVVIGDAAKDEIDAAIKRVLNPLLGKETSSIWDLVKLSVRNAARPSEILRCTFQVPSVTSIGRSLTIEVEANVSERVPHMTPERLHFEVPFRDETQSCEVVSYALSEMLGTKMRALFQRRKGRDLFDLYWALTRPSVIPVADDDIIRAFEHYMRDEDTEVAQSEFLAHLEKCLSDSQGFCSDMPPLLSVNVEYDPQTAGQVVRERLIHKLAEPAARKRNRGFN